MVFELTNAQRRYFGLDAVESGWERVPLQGDQFRPETMLYFEGDRLRRQILSDGKQYREEVFDEATRGRSELLPRTPRGKPQKLTASVLEKRKPLGVYLNLDERGGLHIGHHDTQVTFYSTHWDHSAAEGVSPAERVERFIAASPADHLEQIRVFKQAKKVHVRYRPGDYFSLKLDRTTFGFGRILLDIPKIKALNVLPRQHGLFLAMGKALLVQLFAKASPSPKVPIAELQGTPTLPTSLMMDNRLFYGEYGLIGHRDLQEEELEFPISYSRSIDYGRSDISFLQWGLIYRELPVRSFGKYLTANQAGPAAACDANPYAFHANGFSPTYNSGDVLDAVRNGGRFDFSKSRSWESRNDLRNPANASIRDEILRAFGLDPEESYAENCRRANTLRVTDLLRGR